MTKNTKKCKKNGKKGQHKYLEISNVCRLKIFLIKASVCESVAVCKRKACVCVKVPVVKNVCV